RAAAAAAEPRARVALLRCAIISRRALFELIEDRSGAGRSHTGAGERAAAGRRRVEELVDARAVRVAERVVGAGLRDRDFGLQRAEEPLVARRRAAVMIELHDIDIAGQL